MADWSRTHRTARKPHTCTMCFRVIDAGETYMRGVGFEYGAVWSWLECAQCEVTIKLYDIQWDDYYGPDDLDNWSLNGAHSVQELRDMAGYRMQWRTKYGTLLPVPGRSE